MAWRWCFQVNGAHSSHHVAGLTRGYTWLNLKMYWIISGLYLQTPWKKKWKWGLNEPWPLTAIWGSWCRQRERLSTSQQDRETDLIAITCSCECRHRCLLPPAHTDITSLFHLPEPQCRAACLPPSDGSSRTRPGPASSSSRGVPLTPPETGSASSGPSHRWSCSCTVTNI